ncbi:MAG: Alpha-glucosidase [Bryobacterales bacterium]|nr:Alpha-glucosidase [Bryobacterales bacterium]
MRTGLEGRFAMRVALLILACTLLPGRTHAQAQPAASAPTVILSRVDESHPLKNGIQLRSGHAVTQIIALRDDVLRVRASPEGTLPEDASWAVPQTVRTASVGVEATGDRTSVGFRTKALDVRIDRNPIRLVIRDLAGNILSADATDHATSFRQGSFRIWKDLPVDEHFFGLGDKTGPLDRRDQAFSMWNTDAYGFQESTDPIYKTIPFFLAMRAGRSYGIFLDNTWRSSFDFGREERTAYSFGAEAGPLDYYFVYGPEPKRVVETYAYLTGTPPLPPLWSFGFQQSRYSYAPEAKVREVAARLRSDRIPSDVLWLDIDYQYKNRPFTVDPQGFPDMPKLISDMRAEHFHMVAITDLHVAYAPNQDYAPYDTGAKEDAFVHKPDGSVFIGKVWPGPSVFPDFTRHQSREWWGGLYRQFVDWKFAGFWNDMNEPSVFDGPGKTMPLDTVHRIDEPGFRTRTATHAEIHDVYGMQNARATYEGVLKLNPEERPFVMTRASYAGGQRYSVTWTGDNSSTWNHLRMTTPMLVNLGLSGYAFAGADVGGFAGSPQPDLLTRWLEMAAFQPIDRDHTAKGTNDQEPWVHGPEHEAIRRRFIETRYRLMPYIYTVAEETSRTGLPMIRPLFLEFPHATQDGHPVDLDAGGEFMFGPNLLVAPAPYPDMLDKYSLTLPGAGWYEFWSGGKMPPLPSEADIQAASQASPDGTTLQSPEMQEKMRAVLAWRVTPKLDVLPVFVRGGTILPMQPLVQSTDEAPKGPLEIRVYPGPECKGSLYLDDGHTFRYRQGEFLRETFTCEAGSDAVRVNIAAHQGRFPPWWSRIEMVIYGATRAARSVSVGSTAVQNVRFDVQSGALRFFIDDPASGSEVRIVY